MVEKKVEWRGGAVPEAFYSLAQRDYVTIFARTMSGLIPVVHQFRPAVEEYTLELPAGLVEPGETPEECACRELREETGLIALATRYLGAYYPDTGRLSNAMHLVAIDAEDPRTDGAITRELEVSFLTLDQIKQQIRAGAFRSMPQIGALTVLQLMENIDGGSR